MTLVPRQPVPDLDLPLAGGGRFRLSDEKPDHGTLLVFYRGLHCPICGKQLSELADKMPDFEKRGVGVVAISADPQDRAEQMADNVPGVRIAHDMPLAAARDDWGLYISESRGKTSIGIEELDKFHEPGLMLILPDQTLYFASVQTMPFARPKLDDVLSAIDFVVEKDYPARGHYTGPL